MNYKYMPGAACLTSGKPPERGERLSPPQEPQGTFRTDREEHNNQRGHSPKALGDCRDGDTPLGFRGTSRKKLPGAGRDPKVFASIQEATKQLLD